LLGSKQMSMLLEDFKERYDAVIIDSPPLGVVTDAAVLGTAVDGVLLVARSDHTMADALAYAVEQLQNVQAPVLGAIVNDLDPRKNGSYYSAGYGDHAVYFASTAEQAG
jgi:polysaccharide biosynthesis transport protein